MTAAWDSDVTLIVEASFGEGPFETPVWDDIAGDVRQIITDRQHSRLLDETQAGEGVLVLGNPNSDYDPANTSGAHTPNVNVGTPVRVRATHNAITYDLFRGFAMGWPQQYPDVLDSIVEVPLLDGFGYLAKFESEFTESQELSGTRIGNLLDTVGWPAGLRDIDTGSHTVAAISSEFGTALDEIQRAALVEQGLFWVAGDGNATFRDATTRIQDRTIQAVFSDDGADLSYSFPRRDEDDTQLWNEVHVTRAGGVEQVATDATSITDHGQSDLHLSETLHVADGEANALSEWLADEHGTIRERFSELWLYPMKDPVNLWPVALGLDFWDLVNVEITPSGGSTVDVDCFVQGVSHDITKISDMRWDTTLQLSPDLRHGSDFWILGTSTLGTSTRLAY